MFQLKSVYAFGTVSYAALLVGLSHNTEIFKLWSGEQLGVLLVNAPVTTGHLVINQPLPQPWPIVAMRCKHNPSYTVRGSRKDMVSV